MIKIDYLTNSIILVGMTDKKVFIRFDKLLLEECIKRDGATLLGSYDKLTIDSIINYLCKCSNKHSKSFRSIVKCNGALCKSCSLIKRSEKTQATNIERYGTSHTFQSESVKNKIKESNKDKYGVEYPTQNKEVIEKIKSTNILKYGVTCSVHNPEIKDKVIKTNLERFGVECSLKNDIVKEKIKQTLKEKYGVEHNFESGLLRDKRKETFIKKYGVEHPAQSSEVMEKAQKNAKKYKEYKMPSGTIRKVQGYEPFALNSLVKSYTEEQIKTDRKDVPRIQYKSADDKTKYYFPDIFIPHENKLIEVKSTWTYKCKTDNIQEKARACKEQGYNYEIWCYDSKGNRVEI